jgi:hypothetical protein
MTVWVMVEMAAGFALGPTAGPARHDDASAVLLHGPTGTHRSGMLPWGL